MKTPLIYIAAAVAEIAGCFAFWAWLKLDWSALWLIPGVASLILFAWLLTQVPAGAAGRAFAASPMAGSISSPPWSGWRRSRVRGPIDGTFWALRSA